MNYPSQSIEQALLNVRKAYRLLHDYQRMVMDAVDFIGKQLGLTYMGGWPKFSAVTPKPGKGVLHNWAWDWLNMVEYDFHFTRVISQDETVRVSMLLISDSGYFCSEVDRPVKTNTLDFLPPERSETKIGFLMSAKQWPDPKFMVSREEMRTFIETNGGLPEDYAALGVVARCYGVSRLMSEESTNGLIDELIAVAAVAGIPLKRTGM